MICFWAFQLVVWAVASISSSLTNNGQETGYQNLRPPDDTPRMYTTITQNATDHMLGECSSYSSPVVANVMSASDDLTAVITLSNIVSGLGLFLTIIAIIFEILGCMCCNYYADKEEKKQMENQHELQEMTQQPQTVQYIQAVQPQQTVQYVVQPQNV